MIGESGERAVCRGKFAARNVAARTLNMRKKINHLPYWTFDTQEISAGVYRIKALHRRGPSIEITGTDEQELLDRASKEAE